MSPFDKAPTTSYLTLIETTVYIYLVLLSSYSELFVASRYFNLPHLHLAPLLGWTRIWILPRTLASKKQSPWAIVWHYLYDSAFSCFDTILACDGWTVRWTDTRHTTMANTTLVEHHMVKIHISWFVRGSTLM